jgi:predicted AlkP superfamily pyrophosphatase or phosphodiesterase
MLWLPYMVIRRLWVGRVAALALLCLIAVGGRASSLERPALAQAAAPVSTGSGGINRPEHLAKPSLVLVSFDGFRADYLDRLNLPNFRRVMARGVRAQALRPVFPAITFPNHYSLVTGLHPGRHGIVENTFFDPVRNATYSFRDQATVTDGTWYGGEPIWVTGESQGMVTACFFWPGSEAAIKGVRPMYWNKYDGTVSNANRVATVLEWLRLPDVRRPHLITLYFSDIDSASHRAALDGPEVEKAVMAMDAALGSLLDGIDALPNRDRVILLLTSDHGMANTSAAQTVQLGSLVDTSNIKPSFSGPVAGLHVSGGAGSAQRVRDQLNAKLTSGRAYLRQDLPERYHLRETPRAGDVIVVMDEGWTLATSIINRGLIQSTWGAHGWPPDVASMRALFLIAGPGIRKGVTIPEVENVDVYPLMTELLGLKPAPGIDGRAGRISSLIRDR